MKVNRTRDFVKQYKKLPNHIQEKFNERLRLWLQNPDHSILRVHALKGELQGCWSMNVTGDYRVIYYFTKEDEVVLVLIGTHSQLY